MLYFDNNATTKIAPEVLDFMMPFFGEIYANPSALYTAGRDARAAVEESREKAAVFFNCLPQEIFFTSGGTESDNIAILGAANANPEKKHIITTSIEHPAVLNAVCSLKKRGYTVTYLPVNAEGEVILSELEKNITKATLIVSIMTANNETGVIQPIAEAAEISRRAGVLFHTDAVNAAGKMKLDVRESGVDMLSAAAHKFHGPKGTGILFVRQGTKVEPVICGSKQERGLRPGTENVPLIAGMGKAFELASDFLNDKKRLKEAEANAHYVENEILNNIKGVKLNGSRGNRVWNTVNARFENVEAESIIISMDLAGVALAGGSACASGSMASSHVLDSMGISAKEARSSVRISLSRYTERGQCEILCRLLREKIEKLRAVSAL